METKMPFSFSSILTLLFTAFASYETGKAVVDAGGVASSAAAQVGTEGGKPLYAWVSFSTTRPT